MSSDDKFTLAILVVVIVTTILILMELRSQSGKLGKYEDTIAEYVMCIEYNPDCECSDIILSEYGEEAEDGQ